MQVLLSSGGRSPNDPQTNSDDDFAMRPASDSPGQAIPVAVTLLQPALGLCELVRGTQDLRQLLHVLQVDLETSNTVDQISIANWNQNTN